MHQYKLKIVDCHDSLMWYAKHIGECFPFVRMVEEGFMSREPAGYLNIVRYYDAILLDENDNEVIFDNRPADMR